MTLNIDVSNKNYSIIKGLYDQLYDLSDMLIKKYKHIPSDHEFYVALTNHIDVCSESVQNIEKVYISFGDCDNPMSSKQKKEIEKCIRKSFTSLKKMCELFGKMRV